MGWAGLAACQYSRVTDGAGCGAMLNCLRIRGPAPPGMLLSTLGSCGIATGMMVPIEVIVLVGFEVAVSSYLTSALTRIMDGFEQRGISGSSKPLWSKDEQEIRNVERRR